MLTTRRVLHQAVCASVAALVAIGCSPSSGPATDPAPAPPTATPPAPVTLEIPGRTDSTPWVAAAGEFVAVAWGAGNDRGTDVFVAVSHDGGTTFAAPVQVNATAAEARLGGELPPRVALVAAPGAAAPEIAVVWTARAGATSIKVARSHDGGRTFEPPAVLQAAGAAGDRGWPSATFDAQGRLHVIWLDHRGMAAAKARGGAHVHAPGAATDGAVMAQRSALYYASVGSEPGMERALTTGVCYCCKTTIAAGANGEVHAAWRHVYPGDLRDMAFTTSRDGGRTFAPPQRVSEDRWMVTGCPDDGPAMAVDASGMVHLVWPTVLPGDTPQGALFYATARSGEPFGARVQVPTLGGRKPTHPQIVVGAGGRVVVAWDEVVNGERVASLRNVRQNPDGSPAFGAVVTIARDAMYPVLAATNRRVVAVWTQMGEQSTIGVRIFPD